MRRRPLCHEIQFVDCVGSRLGREQYDFVHARFLTGGVRNFTALYEKAFHAIRPGGWIEVTESAWDLRPATASQHRSPFTTSWSLYLKEAFCSMRKQCPDLRELPDMLRSAGFSRIQSVSYIRSIGREHRGVMTSDEEDVSEVCSPSTSVSTT